MQRLKLILFLGLSGIIFSLIFVDQVSAIRGENLDPLAKEDVSQVDLVQNQDVKPVMELVFCLDATGSMSGLIKTAKEKVWDIVTEVSQSNPTPDIRLGMVFYRDIGDDFTTRVYPLTSDIDSIYSELLSIEAKGGGDTPESVNQALNEAVTQMGWGEGQNVYRTIFLVGDCPPHMDYQHDVKHPITCKISTEKGIFINTIKLGSQCDDAVLHFKAIAEAAGGEYKQLGQHAEDVVMETPYDDSIRVYSNSIDKSKIYYGSTYEKRMMNEKKRNALRLYDIASSNAVASRANYNTSLSGNTNLFGKKELIDELMSGKVKLSNIKEEELPDQVREVNETERFEYLKQLQKIRASNIARLKELTAARAKYISIEKEKNPKRSSFSKEVYDLIKRQATNVNFLRSGLESIKRTNPATGMNTTESSAIAYPSAKVSLTDFADLIAEVDKDRNDWLLSLDDFLIQAKNPNTIIFDARSRNMFERRHIKGAINLPYTEFNQEALRRLIPDPETRILIYCNNNFEGDQIAFASKVFIKPVAQRRGVEPRLLALNIPTHVTLRGYGYQNVYELDELVDVLDTRMKEHWGGTTTLTLNSRLIRSEASR